MSQAPVPDHAQTLMANEASVGTTRRVMPGAVPAEVPAPAPSPAVAPAPAEPVAPAAPVAPVLAEPVATPEPIYLAPEVQETPQVSIHERMNQLNDLQQSARDQFAALEAALKK